MEGRRTWSDGDSVERSRAELTCVAMRLEKSLGQDQAETPGTQKRALILRPGYG